MAIVKVQPLSDLFTAGRACPLTAVVLHEYKSDLSTLDNEMQQCVRLPKPLCSPSCHKSFHFGIGANCLAHQYINIEDTAWGFWYEPTPACPVPPCPIVQTCDGVGADQYNPHMDGTPATPNVSVGGVCLDANCSVIHVAVSVGAGRVSDGIYCIRSPQFSEAAYACLVLALCEIFELAGLTPDGYTNLLTHIGELASIDLDILALDIQECLDFVPPPPPPCECSVPIVGVDTASVDMVVAGLNISANVRISAAVGNQASIVADGIFVPADTEVPITPVDTTSINLTASGVDNHTIQADLIISPDAGNQAVVLVNGLFVAETPITPVDTNTIDLTISGVNSHTVQADVIISPDEGNILVAQVDGLYVPVTQVCAELSSLPTGADAIAGTLLLGDDCEYHAVPDFQTALVTPACIGLPSLPVVLGGDGTTLGDPIWGTPARMPLAVVTFTAVLDTIGVEGTDVWVYTGGANHAVDLEGPAAECTTNDLWIKNRSAFTLTITPVVGTIDGVASITLAGTNPGTYPFGTDGGEAVHLIWDGTNWIIV